MYIPSLLALAAAALPLTTALPTTSTLTTRETIQETTDNLLFVKTMPQFQEARNARNPSTLDWSSDNCSSSPDNPLGFKFTQSCQRHDFGYRNYKKQSRFTETNRKRIDDNFLKDLNNYCDGVSAVLEGACKALAQVYYKAVREFGSKKMIRREDGSVEWLEVDPE